MTPKVTVESFRPHDAGTVAEVRRAAVPYLVCTGRVGGLQGRVRPRGRTHALAGRQRPGGRVVGCADAGLLIGSVEPGQGYLHTAVHPDSRGLGAGAALVAEAERHLSGMGAERVWTWVSDDGRSNGFAERRGCTRGRRACFLGLDPARAGLPDPPERLPADVELRTVLGGPASAVRGGLGRGLPGPEAQGKHRGRTRRCAPRFRAVRGLAAAEPGPAVHRPPPQLRRTRRRRSRLVLRGADGRA
ncbi:GNAT family N-acetyltransferase [Streptomyces bathyalis]|uniref:GNAT family N-acetyltransferase n=1 Tax=Streptomyces bathyalis TaxID=2710756 RepID=A0A7T1TAV9_9ACTN|nr:GNAT family N-acetyltransferase [Streptomyces bathyalis]